MKPAPLAPTSRSNPLRIIAMLASPLVSLTGCTLITGNPDLVPAITAGANSAGAGGTKGLGGASGGIAGRVAVVTAGGNAGAATRSNLAGSTSTNTIVISGGDSGTSLGGTSSHTSVGNAAGAPSLGGASDSGGGTSRGGIGGVGGASLAATAGRAGNGVGGGVTASTGGTVGIAGGGTGGVATGGVATGGVATGGVATGGVATGGVATGGTSAVIPAVKQIALGSYHACALYHTGKVKCWGRNDSGQLGNGDTSGISTATPVDVSNLNNAKAIAAGDANTCALLTDKTVKCWGFNGAGQIGDGSTETRYAPVQVQGGLSDVSSIAVGIGYACATKSTATYCWGNNTHAELGNNDATLAAQHLPVPVANDFIASRLAASYHTCGIGPNTGILSCWGYNYDSEVGSPSCTATQCIIPETTLSDVLAVDAGGSSSCAVVSTGEVQCWGGNDSGQLGNDPNVTLKSNIPLKVTGVSQATQVASQWNFHCALAISGAQAVVQCWGVNTWGQLGIPSSTESSHTPQLINGLDTPASISVGFHHACALRKDGLVYCWGRNNHGQIGADPANVPLSTTALKIEGL